MKYLCMRCGIAAPRWSTYPSRKTWAHGLLGGREYFLPSWSILHYRSLNGFPYHDHHVLEVDPRRQPKIQNICWRHSRIDPCLRPCGWRARSMNVAKAVGYSSSHGGGRAVPVKERNNSRNSTTTFHKKLVMAYHLSHVYPQPALSFSISELSELNSLIKLDCPFNSLSCLDNSESRNSGITKLNKTTKNILKQFRTSRSCTMPSNNYHVNKLERMERYCTELFEKSRKVYISMYR